MDKKIILLGLFLIIITSAYATDFSDCDNITATGTHTISGIDTTDYLYRCISVLGDNIFIDCLGNDIHANVSNSILYIEGNNITLQNCNLYHHRLIDDFAGLFQVTGNFLTINNSNITYLSNLFINTSWFDKNFAFTASAHQIYSSHSNYTYINNLTLNPPYNGLSHDDISSYFHHSINLHIVNSTLRGYFQLDNSSHSSILDSSANMTNIYLREQIYPNTLDLAYSTNITIRNFNSYGLHNHRNTLGFITTHNNSLSNYYSNNSLISVVGVSYNAIQDNIVLSNLTWFHARDKVLEFSRTYTSTVENVKVHSTLHDWASDCPSATALLNLRTPKNIVLRNIFINSSNFQPVRVLGSFSQSNPLGSSYIYDSYFNSTNCTDFLIYQGGDGNITFRLYNTTLDNFSIDPDNNLFRYWYFDTLVRNNQSHLVPYSFINLNNSYYPIIKQTNSNAKLRLSLLEFSFINNVYNYTANYSSYATHPMYTPSDTFKFNITETQNLNKTFILLNQSKTLSFIYKLPLGMINLTFRYYYNGLLQPNITFRYQLP